MLSHFNQVLYDLCLYSYTRPRYQVSVYKTIGPLVFCFVVDILDLVHDAEARGSLIWVCTVCQALSVPKLRIITVDTVVVFSEVKHRPW